jgi:DNA-binding CsgD family transcriptional regulator
VGWYAKQRAADRIARAAGAGLDLVAFWNEVGEAIAAAIPHHLTPCWYTLDPASLLATSHYDHGLIPELPPEWLAHEYHEEDFQSLGEVARSPSGISTLHDATGGDPSRSRRWQIFMQPYGGDQELLVSLRTAAGETWGMLALYRESGQPLFDREELELLRLAAPGLAEGARRGLLIGAAADPDTPDAPGLVVLSEDWQMESLTPGVERWLEPLPGGAPRDSGRLPPSLLAVAGRALRTAERDTPGEVAVTRVLADDGRWIVLHGATLISDGTRRVAVIVEPASRARISPLLMSAYGLTEREQEITRLVLRGESTTQIAQTLYISPHTVQQHLKSVFEKTGVRSRRELVGKVFFAHYEPRLRDNERRAIDGRPLRGDPSPAA